MTTTKLLLETLRLADNGRVVCDMATPDGSRVQGVIERTFFEEFSASPAALNPSRQLRIVQENVNYLEAEAERLWQQGQQALVIR